MYRQRCDWIGRVFLGMLFVASATVVDAATIFTGGNFPASPEILGTPPEDTTFGQDAGSGGPSVLGQSFQTDTAFSLNHIWVYYENDTNAPGDKTVTMTIFTVADVNATTHAEPPLAGDIVFSEDILFPYVGNTETVARIDLDSPLAIAAAAGTEGYILSFSGGGDPGWEWERDGSSGGNAFPGGVAYEEAAAKISGGHTVDFSFALSSSVPEPSGLVLATLAMLAGGLRRKR
ncbi:PEP-CTERM sorting domain-containing protein [Adhaeretor mobilis]|uniref:PEP-CTERM protein-sorting domain-containing protein n=1 Tax=Adhaeretor mobilis TaxID=1930276 RepID=A0A517MWD7_9BACT|nr:PEP-CTERM sorting domain-containing protein [Adhaeretor mobilis]QDS99194.1 hypothetical protein HG15A2_24860 [Adhaeretor mobilis]